MMMGIGMGFGGIVLILLLLFFGALIVGGVWLVKTIAVDNPSNHLVNKNTNQPSAQEILDQRYARGEISQEEYERIKTDLS